MNPLTLTTNTFTLEHGTTPISGNVTYVGVTATFTPSTDLIPNTVYRAMITTGVMDLAGNAMTSPYVWRWITSTIPDITKPVMSSTTPANNATGVAINSTISATFNEVMYASTLTTATFSLQKGNFPVSGKVTFTGMNSSLYAYRQSRGKY